MRRRPFALLAFPETAAKKKEKTTRNTARSRLFPHARGQGSALLVADESMNGTLTLACPYRGGRRAPSENWHGAARDNTLVGFIIRPPSRPTPIIAAWGQCSQETREPQSQNKIRGTRYSLLQGSCWLYGCVGYRAVGLLVPRNHVH